jgi:cephalosporin-C deacetylase-like acetyl esterase
MRYPFALLPLLLAAPLFAEDIPPSKMLRTYLHDQAKTQFDARRQAIELLKTPDDVRKRQDMLRQRFLDAIGAFPEKTPLNPKVNGTLKYNDYRVEKVIYESRPNHHVTANLYIPEGKGPFPGVLIPLGHSDNGKAAETYQRAAILLAKNGMVALAYDPIGQGERRQLLDDGKPAIKNGTDEHTMTDIGALLVGRCTANYRIWDGIRSLDYLASRPEVDPKRLGCTGNSGGGTLTAYLMALDDRIVAAAPSCYITSLERLFSTIGPQDGEQNIPRQVSFGMEHSDYVTMRAPKPTLICCATRDFFDIQGTWTSFREAKRIYGVLGYPERVDIVENNATHGFAKPLREAMVRWMRRWLLNIDDAVTEGDFPIAKDADLQCTRTGQVLDDFKGKSVFHLNADREAELAKERANPRTKEDLLKDVARLAGIRLPIAEAMTPRDGRDGPRLGNLNCEIEPGITIPRNLISQHLGKFLTIYVNGEGQDSIPDKTILALVKADKMVLTVDLRGQGQLAPGKTAAGKPNLFGVDTHEAYVAMHLNRPLLGQRVHDLLAVAKTQAKLQGLEGFELIGVGSAGPIVLHAAALEPRVKAVTLENSIVSWSDVVRSPLSYNQLTNVVPGALKVYDLPDLAATLAGRTLTIRNPVDPAGKPLTQEAADQAYKHVRTAFEREKAKDKFTVVVEKK